ncbi:hypothetical protein IT397_03075, partial [Candidatus Nomurabacteria bacterium]|nr:hypothetical protein [Candidatus Nomurabacteria bacterium]
MDKKSKILIWVMFVLIIISVAITFYRYVIKKDYIIIGHITCNPKIESCFYVPCDGSDCPTEIEYYKKISKKAYNIELCDPSTEGCNPLVCKENEQDCQINTCSLDNLEEGEKCS